MVRLKMKKKGTVPKNFPTKVCKSTVRDGLTQNVMSKDISRKFL